MFFVWEKTKPLLHREVFYCIRTNGDEWFHHGAQFSPFICCYNASHTWFRVLVDIKYLNLKIKEIYFLLRHLSFK